MYCVLAIAFVGYIHVPGSQECKVRGRIEQPEDPAAHRERKAAVDDSVVIRDYVRPITTRTIVLGQKDITTAVAPNAKESMDVATASNSTSISKIPL